MLWVRIDNTLLAFIYHPPNPVYQTESILIYIEACVEELSDDYPFAQIVISGDVNQLRVQEVEERTGLIQIVQQPTRGANILDCVFTSEPLYGTVRVVESICSSDHRVVTACCSVDQCRRTKATTKHK
jgi:hypothetical protein